MGITKILYINRDTSAGGSTHLKDALAYIMRPEKTEDGQLIGGANCLYATPEVAYKQMMQTKRFLGKEDGRQAYHFIISLAKGEGNKDVMMDIMQRFGEAYLGQNYEYVYAVHTDKEHMHGHLIFNSVSRMDGLKYRYKQGDWERDIQPITNKLCAEYGLSTIELDQERNRDWKSAMREDIDECKDEAVSYDDFIKKLEALGYTVRDGKNRKYLTLIPPGKNDGRAKGHRTHLLGEAYSKAALLDYFGEPTRKAGPTEDFGRDMDDKKREKQEKWENITDGPYISQQRTKEFRRLFVDYRKENRKRRTYHDRRAYLYKEDVKKLRQKMERQKYMLDYHLVTTEDVENRYKTVGKLLRETKKAYKQVNAEFRINEPGYELYDMYLRYKALDEMYAVSNSDNRLFEYHLKYLDILKQIEESPYDLSDFERLEAIKNTRNKLLKDMKVYNREKKMLNTILESKSIKKNPDLDGKNVEGRS